jgi:hypothetical protein
MPDPKPLDQWRAGEVTSAGHLQRMQDRIEEVRRLTGVGVRQGVAGSTFLDTPGNPGAHPWVPFKLNGDVTLLGGAYKILIGSPGSNTLNLSPTSATTLSLTNSIDFTNTNNTGFLINTKEAGSQLRLLSTSDGVVRWGPLIFSATNAADQPVIVQEIPLPLTLSCTNTAAATNAPVYTLFRHGTSTNQALAVSQTPWRQVSLSGISGTNLPTITAATNCNYFLSGTGVVMAGSGETIPNNLCT